ncbi:MAG: WYL domain-containing protein [Candidatus Zixiibacteriota bacterium]|nr:MAG: WYL domain-containing protein [candidate division Zixibacteria bacterium]
MRWKKMDDHFLQSLEFVAFDTETTGLWAAANRIVEIGAIKFRLGRNDCRRFQALVNPERPIPLETVNVHGITDTMVKDAELARPVLREFLDFCGGQSVLIAHNARFDISFVGSELDRAELPMPDNIILDTVDIFRVLHPELQSYSLLSLARQFSISRAQRHRAADDAALVWKLFALASEEFPYVDKLSTLTRIFPRYYMSQWQGETRSLPDQYTDITQAIDLKRRLQIVYQPDKSPPQTRIIRPTRVHWHRQKYYIAAYCEKAEAERTFRLDRIVSFQLIA